MTPKPMKQLVAAALLLFAVPLARAEIYRVDLIVFLDKSAPGEQGRGYDLPDLSHSINLDNAADLKAAGISVLPEEKFALNNEWQHLKLAKSYQPLMRLAWTQENPPAERGPALHLRWGSTLIINDPGSMTTGLVSPVDGSVALLLGRYLHLDADLIYSQKTETGVASYRLREKRRMKRDELHHLDSPRLGIVAKVSKVPAGGG